MKLTRPRLPAFIDEISIRNLRVGPDTLDLVLERHENDVGTNVVRRTGSVEVIAIK